MVTGKRVYQLFKFNQIKYFRKCCSYLHENEDTELFEVAFDKFNVNKIQNGDRKNNLTNVNDNFKQIQYLEKYC